MSQISSTALLPKKSGSEGVSPLDVIRLFRSGGKAIFGQAALYGELARVEWVEEKKRLTNMFVAGAAAFAFMLCMLLSIGVLVLALSWDTAYRVPAVVVMMVMYATGLGIAWFRARALLASGEQAFAVMREELAADLALIKSKL